MSSEQPSSSPPPGASSPWGSYDGKGGAPVANEAKPTSRIGHLDPISQRLLRLAGLLSVLLLLVLLNSFVNEDGGSTESPGSPGSTASTPGGPASTPAPSNPVAAAAERMEDFSGARMSLYIVYSSPTLPGPVTASGSGALNQETERSRITLDIKSPVGGAPVRSIQISDGKFEYTGGALVAKELPPGKEWVRTKKGAEDDDTSPMTFEESLEVLDASAETRLIGRESINGTMTRHYRGEIQVSDIVRFLREKGKETEAGEFERIEGMAPTQVSSEAWIDGKNLLRRMRMVMPMPGEPGEPPMTIDMRMDFFDYGAKPKIELPAPASVVEGPLDEDEGAPAPASVS